MSHQLICRTGHVHQKVAVRHITKIEKSEIFNFFENLLVDKHPKSCYEYYEELFQSKFDRKWKDTQLTLCYFCINISL